MNVLVTGATGFTGGHLAIALRRRGHAVCALVRPRSLAKAAVLEREGISIAQDIHWIPPAPVRRKDLV